MGEGSGGGWAFSYFRFPRSDAHQILPLFAYSCGGVGRRSRTWFSPLTSRRRPASSSHRTTSPRYAAHTTTIDLKRGMHLCSSYMPYC